MKAKRPSKLKRARTERAKPRSVQRVVQCEVVRAAIAAEPELPGEMPDGLWTAWRLADKEAAVEILRITVRETKRGIMERLGL